MDLGIVEEPRTSAHVGANTVVPSISFRVDFMDVSSNEWDDGPLDSPMGDNSGAEGDSQDSEIVYVSQSLQRVPIARWRNFNYHVKYKCFGATSEMGMGEALRQQMTPCKFCVPMVPGGETFIALKRKQHLTAEPRKDAAKNGKGNKLSRATPRISPRDASSVDSSSETTMDVDTPRSYNSDSYSDASHSPYATPRDSFFMPRERIQTLEEFFDVRAPVGPAFVRPTWPESLPVYPSRTADFDDFSNSFSYASDCSDAVDYSNNFDSWDPYPSAHVSPFT